MGGSEAFNENKHYIYLSTKKAQSGACNWSLGCTALLIKIFTGGGGGGGLHWVCYFFLGNL